MRRIGWAMAGAVAATAAMAGTGARAQLWPPSISRSHLPPADLSAAADAGRSLFQNPDAKAGQTSDWSSTASGDSGRATLVGERTLRGLPCRTVRYDFTLKAGGNRSYTLDWCRTPAGEWRIGS